MRKAKYIKLDEEILVAEKLVNALLGYAVFRMPRPKLVKDDIQLRSQVKRLSRLQREETAFGKALLEAVTRAE